MKASALLIPALVLSGCAGAQTEFSSVTATGSIPGLVECAEDAITDEGFVVTSRDDDAGLLQAANGAAWLRVQIIPGQSTYYEVNVETADSDVARDAAQEIVTECGTGPQ